MDGPSAPPGWYVDPTARHAYRYWNGTAWTEDIADEGQRSLDPLDPLDHPHPHPPAQSPTVTGATGAVPAPMTETDKAFLINVGVATLFPPWLLVVLVWWLLSRRHVRSQPHYRRALGTMILVGSSLYAALAVLMLVMLAVTKEPAVAPGTPQQVFDLPEAGHGFTSGVVVQGPNPFELRISFGERDIDPEGDNPPESDKPTLQSLGGKWSGSRARLVVDGGGTIEGGRTIEGAATQHESEWPSTLGDEGSFRARPEMTVALPLTPDDVHQELTVVARMQVGLPRKADATHYSVTGVDVSRTVTLFVITEEEMSQRIDRNTVEDRGAIASVAGALLLVAALAGWAGWKKRRSGT